MLLAPIIALNGLRTDPIRITDTPEYKNFAAAIQAMPTFEVTYWTNLHGTDGRLVRAPWKRLKWAGQDRFVLETPRELVYWLSGKAIHYSRYDNRRIVDNKRPDLDVFALIPGLTSEPNPANGALASPMTREVLQSWDSRTYQTECGWKVSYQDVYNRFGYELWFEPNTSLLKDIFVKNNAYECDYRFDWGKKPPEPSAFDPKPLARVRRDDNFGPRLTPSNLPEGRGAMLIEWPTACDANIEVEPQGMQFHIRGHAGRFYMEGPPGVFRFEIPGHARAVSIVDGCCTRVQLGAATTQRAKLTLYNSAGYPEAELHHGVKPQLVFADTYYIHRGPKLIPVVIAAKKLVHL